MGFISQLLSRFVKPEAVHVEPEKAFIKKEDLKEWFIAQKNSEFYEVKIKIENYLTIIKDNREALKHSLEVLEFAKLQNPNVPVKVKQVMDGNRKSYIQKYNLFIERLKYPDDITAQSANDFCKYSYEQLDLLKRTTGKADIVLKEFFANQILDVNKKMKEIATSIVKIDELLGKDNFAGSKIDSTQDLIEEYLTKSKQEQEFYEELKTVKAEFVGLKESLDEINAKIASFKNTSDYQRVMQLEARRSALIENLNRLSEELRSKFSLLERPLKKYQRMTIEHEKLISSYLDDPLKALINDKEFAILRILEKIKLAIHDDSIELKDKSKEKVIAAVGLITRQFLQSVKNNYDETKKDKYEVDRKLAIDKSQRNHEEYIYKAEHLLGKVERKQDEVNELSRKIDRLDVDGLKRKVESAIKDSMGTELKITE